MAKASRARTTARPTQPRLFRTQNDLPAATRAEVCDLLNQRLADCIDLQTQCKQAHWNVKGPGFIGLHKLFDEINEAVEGYVDLIAERVVQLGGRALGTARVVAGRSVLNEYPLEAVTGADHVAGLAAALSEFGRVIRTAIEETDELGDKDASDLCTDVSRDIDKWLWFVEAHRQGEITSVQDD